MTVSVSKFVLYRQEDTEKEMNRFFTHLINQGYEQKELTESMFKHFQTLPTDTLDQLQQCFTELGEAVKNKRKYQIIESLEKGSELLDLLPPEEIETRKRYGFRLKQLAEELERIS